MQLIKFSWHSAAITTVVEITLVNTKLVRKPLSTPEFKSVTKISILS